MAEVAERTPWARLTLDPAATGFVGYEDSAGRVVRSPTLHTGGRTRWDYIPDPVGLRWAARSTRALFDLAGRLPVIREGLYGGHPVPLAVLVELPLGVAWTLVLEEQMRALLRTVGLAESRYTLAAAVAPIDSAAFGLPFDVGVVGSDSDAGWLASSLTSMLGGISPTDLEYAMRVRPIDPLDPVSAGPLPPDLDILVTPPTFLLDVSRSGGTGPRLIVLDDPMGTIESLTVDQLPAGSSILGLPPGTTVTATEMTRQVIWALTHDWPLHEAVLAASRRLGLADMQQGRVRLMTSPAALDGFRLLGPFEKMRRQAREVFRYRGAAVERPAAPGTGSRIDEAVERAGEAVAEFHREEEGFSEVVRANAAIDRARPHMEELAREFAGLPAAQRSALEENQGRRVAIWVEHDPMTMRRDRFPSIGPSTALAQGRRYLVNVGVGIAWPTDLVPRDTPAVDPILPPVDDDDGHDLTVTVFSATSRVLDQPSKPLRLGRLGPSLPVTFLVETPRRRRTTRLRVVVYHRGHIIQSFQLTARLAANEWSVGGRLAVELEFSRRERLSDLDGLPERELSVVTNDDGGGAHALMFESGDRLVLDDDTARTIREDYRKTLEDVRKKLRRQSKLAAVPFADVLRHLAAEGHENFKAIMMGASPELSRKIGQVTDGRGRTIQILRTKPSFAHPWVAVYDWELPRPEVLSKAAVCLGAAGCGCTPTSAQAICVNGFWGVRHVVEEMLIPAQRHVATVAGAPGVPSVVCTVGTRDSWSKAMVTDLVGDLGSARVEDHVKDRSLLERLWDVAARPAVLVVLGHLETSPIHRYEREHPRITVCATEGYLDTSSILDMQRLPAPRWWENPLQPVVLLLGCNTARSGLGSVHNFVQGLARCGASTVIATEEIIDTRMARAVASTVVPLLDAVGPGEALRAWRAREIANGNPLGFMLTCFGSADVTVPALRS
jgi:hypothetical protein